MTDDLETGDPVAIFNVANVLASDVAGGDYAQAHAMYAA